MHGDAAFEAQFAGRRTIRTGIQPHFRAGELEGFEAFGQSEEGVLGRAADLFRAFGMDGHAREHSLHHVIGHVTVEQPGAGIVRHHVGDLHARGQEFHHVGAAAAFLDHPQAVPVRGVKILFGSKREEIPAHALALIHFKARRVPEDVAVDRGTNSLFGAFLHFGPGELRHVHSHGAVLGGFARGGAHAAFIVKHEQRGHFAVGVVRSAVGPGAHGIGHHDEPDEAEACFLVAVDMTVVEPAAGGRFARERAGMLVELPHVGELRAVSDGGTESGTRFIVGALAVLVVFHTVRVHRERAPAAIEEGYRKKFSHGAAQDGAEQAEARRLDDFRLEGGIGILHVTNLAAAAVDLDRGRKRFAANRILSERRIVPQLRFRSDVVVAGLGRVRRLAEEFSAAIAHRHGGGRADGDRRVGDLRAGHADRDGTNQGGGQEPQATLSREWHTWQSR